MSAATATAGEPNSATEGVTRDAPMMNNAVRPSAKPPQRIKSRRYRQKSATGKITRPATDAAEPPIMTTKGSEMLSGSP